MEEIYIWGGSEYSLAEISDAASTAGLSVNDYLNKHGISKTTKEKEEKFYVWEDNNYSETEINEAVSESGLSFEDYTSKHGIKSVSEVGWGSEAGERATGDWFRGESEEEKIEKDFSSTSDVNELTLDQFTGADENDLVFDLEEFYGGDFEITRPTRPGVDAVNLKSKHNGKDITVYTGGTAIPDVIEQYNPLRETAGLVGYVGMMEFINANRKENISPIEQQVYSQTGLVTDNGETWDMQEDIFTNLSDYSLSSGEVREKEIGGGQYLEREMSAEDIIKNANFIENSIVNILKKEASTKTGPKFFTEEAGVAVEDPSWYERDTEELTKEKIADRVYNDLIRQSRDGKVMSRNSFDELLQKKIFKNRINNKIRESRDLAIKVNSSRTPGLKVSELENDYNTLSNEAADRNPLAPEIQKANQNLESALETIIHLEALKSNQPLSATQEQNLSNAKNQWGIAANFLRKKGADIHVDNMRLDNSLLSEDEKKEVEKRKKMAVDSANSQNVLNNSNPVKDRVPTSTVVKENYADRVETELQILDIGSKEKININLSGGGYFNSLIKRILEAQGKKITYEDVIPSQADMTKSMYYQDPLGKGTSYLLDENGNRINSVALTYNELLQAGVSYKDFEGLMDESMHYVSETDRVNYKAWQLEYYGNNAEKRGFFEVAYLGTDPEDMPNPIRDINTWSDIPGYAADVVAVGGTAALRMAGTSWLDQTDQETFNYGESKRDRMSLVESTIDKINASEAVTSGQAAPLEITKAGKKNLDRGYTEATAEGIGGFVPTLVEFALFEAATMGYASPLALARLGRAIKAGKEVSTLTELVAGTQVGRFSVGALREEVKMQMNTADFGLGTGLFFHGFGSAMSKMRFIPKNMPELQRLSQKYLTKGPSGAMAIEADQIVHAMGNELLNNADFKETMDELYGDEDEVFKRVVANTLMFQLTGVNAKDNIFTDVFTKEGRSNYLFTKNSKLKVQSKLREKSGLSGNNTSFKYDKNGNIDTSSGTVKEIWDNLNEAQKRDIESELPKDQLVTLLEILGKSENNKLNKLGKKLHSNISLYHTLSQRINIQTKQNALQQWVIDPKTGEPKIDSNGEFVVNPQFEQNLHNHLNSYFDTVRLSNAFTNKEGKNLWENPKIVTGRGDAWRSGKLEGKDTTARFDEINNVLYLDLNKYTAGKPIHEVGHAIIHHFFKDNPIARDNFLTEVKSFANETKDMKFSHSVWGDITGKDLFNKISKKYSEDKGYTESDRTEEYFTYLMELAADPMVKATNKYLTGKTYAKVIGIMDKIGQPLGLSKTNIKTGTDIMSTIYNLNKGIVKGKYDSKGNKFMRRTRDKYTVKGNDVSALTEMQYGDQGESYEKLIEAEVKAKKAHKKSIDFDFTGDKTTEQITQENTDIVKNIQARAKEMNVTPYEAKTPEDQTRLWFNNTRLPREVLSKYEGRHMMDKITKEAFLESLDKQLQEYARRYGNTAYTKQKTGESKEAFEARKKLISNLEIPFGAYAIEGLKKQVGNALVDAGVAYKEGNKIILLQKVSGEASDKIFEGLVEKGRSATGKALDFQEGRTDAQGNAKLDPITVVKDGTEAKEIISKLDADAEKINWEKENFSYKTTPDFSGVAKYFGVKEKKVNKPDGKIDPKSTRLTQKEVESAQNRINEQAKEIFDSWANGYAESGKEGVRGYSTGIQNVLLKAVDAKGKALFYREGEFAQKTGPGLVGKEKLAFNETGMKEFFGIVDGKFQTLKENGKIDQRLKAAIHQLGKSITGKQFEKWLKENKPEGWQNYVLDMSSGKGPERASKELFEDRLYGIKFNSKQKEIFRKLLDDQDFVDKNTLGELLLDNAFIDIGAIDRQRIIKGFKDAINDPTNITKVKEIIEKMDQKYFNEYVEALAENTGLSLEQSKIFAEKEIGDYKELYKELGVDYVAGVGRGPEINDKSINDYKKSIKSLLEGLDLDMLEAQNNTLLSSIIASITQRGTLKFGEYTGHGGKFKRGDSITKTRLIGSRTGSNAEFVRTLLEDSSFGKPKSKAKTKKYLKKAKYSFQPSYDAKGNKGHGEKIAELYKKNPKKWLEEAQKYYAHKDAIKDFDTLQEAIDATYEANRYVYKEFYKSLLKLPNSASLLLSRLQTSASSGVPRGLVSMMSLTTKPKQKVGKSTDLTHNEHALEMFNISKRFHEIKNSDLSMAQKRELVDLMAEGVAQHLIPKELQGVKDSKPYGGSKGRVSFNDILNTFVTEKSGQDQVFIAGEYAGMKVSEMIMKRYGKEIAKELIESIPVKDLNSEGWKLKQRVDNSKNYDKIIEDNFSEAKDYDVYAEKASKDLFEDALNNMENRDIANRISLRRNNPIKKARVFDFDDTVARTNSKVFATKDGKKKTLTAEEFAKQGEKLTNEGWKMDFSDFNEVVEGKKGPLFEVMKQMKEAAGERDMFILTARAQESAPAIHKFLKEMGIDIPLKNITGLGNSSGEAKAQWLVDKAAEGYNDFYFADDAPQNVRAVKKNMSKLDVKSKVQLVKASKDLTFGSSEGRKKLKWETNEVGNMKTAFNIGDKKYNFEIYPKDSKGTFEVAFDLDGRKDVTNTGNAVKVIRTVYDGILDAVNQNKKIKQIEFSARKGEPSRVKLYTTLMDRLGKKLGWETDIWETTSILDEDGGHFDFEIAKPKTKRNAVVEQALESYDVKSKTQQAKNSLDLSTMFNHILQDKSGIEHFKEFSEAKAKVLGAAKDKFQFFVPYSAEDFTGLLYPTLAKGKRGEMQMEFYKKHLLNPYSRAMGNLSRDRTQLMADFKALKKQLNVPKNLQKRNETGFTNEQAVRVYLWDKLGNDIPGISKKDKAELIKIIEDSGELKAFAEQMLDITKGDGYSTPTENWLAGTITTDLIDLINTTKRSKYLETWKSNIDQIFSKENLNKLEAIYGSKYRSALESSLRRMISGKNREASSNRLSNQILDYINGSNAAIMFLNTRSAALQTISAINFVNWSFNNPYKAGKAFANQKQYWKDFIELFNSDYLVDRRNGLKININESEVANAAKTSKNKTKALISLLLEKGYLPTQIMDSVAIAGGGSTYFRNRINDLTKKGMSLKDARSKAYTEFKELSETSQQSSDPSKISQQQASDAGRLLLMFANTPMQYTRLQKRAIQDLVAGRGSKKENISKVIYYGFVQNLIFNALQQAAYAIGFGDDDDAKDKKALDVANGMIDSTLRGLGMGGQAVSVGKNFLLDIYERSGRSRPQYSEATWELLKLSPPLGSKVKKIKNAMYAFDSKKRRQEIYDKGISLDNPALISSAKIISATTNIPLDRVLQKIENLGGVISEDAEWWQRLAMLGGWPRWQLEPKKAKKKKSKKKSIQFY